MASSRRKQDEKHLKILRELGSQAFNRTCFDCHQRGTTYINMTVGSFVCTSCSGILRGLNPPHRVKSISMASFTPDEIEQIKSKGNQYCQAVWLGLYDSKTSPFPDTKDEHKIRDFMITKYEKKRYYVEPSVALKNMPPQPSSATSSNASTPSGDNSKSASSLSRPNVSASQSSGSVGVNLNGPSKIATPKSSTSLDLLADLGNQSSTPSTINSNDPFASPTNTQAPASISQPSFANFENANIFTNPTESEPSQIPSIRYSHNQPSPPTPPPLAPPPSSSRSASSTRSNTPHESPVRYNFNRWEAFDGEEALASSPLIPQAESVFSLDASGRPVGMKGKNTPTMTFAAGVSAQFVCPTNSNYSACSKEEGKLPCSPLVVTPKSTSSSSSKSSFATSHVSMKKPPSIRECRIPNTDEETNLSSSFLVSSFENDKSSHSQSNQQSSQPSTPKNFSSNSKSDDLFTYSLNKNSSPLASLFKDHKNVIDSNKTTLATSNEISPKCFSAFLTKTSSKLNIKTNQNISSKKNSNLNTKIGNENLGIEIGQIALELEGKSRTEPRNILNQEVCKVATEPEGMKLPNESTNVLGSNWADLDEVSSSCTPVGSVIEVNTNPNPFLSSGSAVSTPKDNPCVFDKVPLFNKRRLDASKPISINRDSNISSSSLNSGSSLPPSMIEPYHASSFTNPFVSGSQPATNILAGRLSSVIVSRSVTDDSPVFNCFSSSSDDVFVHDSFSSDQPKQQQQQQLNCNNVNNSTYMQSMTPANYLIAGSSGSTSSSNKTSTPSGGPPPFSNTPFSNNPLTPMTPGSTSATSSSNPTTLPNSSSSVNQTKVTGGSAQDRYAALKDLDEEFKLHKDEPVTSNGGGNWAVPNGSQNTSNNVSNGGSVFGSPGTLDSVFSSGLVNGVSSNSSAVGGGGGGGGNMFGTPPNNCGTGWANFSGGANPFSGSSNGTPGSNPWVNGSNTFGNTTQNQGFGSIVQPNPFGTTPDPNFNQFGNSGTPINGTSSNGVWGNFSQQQPQQNAKVQWMGTPNGTANPFMASPQMPSSGTSYNPFL